VIRYWWQAEAVVSLVPAGAPPAHGKQKCAVLSSGMDTRRPSAFPRRVVGVFVAGLLGLSHAEPSSAGPAALPLAGETPAGQKWRLEAGKADESDDVRASWCARLRYTEDIVVDGDPFVGGLSTCGPWPARRASGAVAVNCTRHSVFVFGGARSTVRAITAHSRLGPVVRATEATLPPKSGFKGYTFMLVLDTRRLPARIQAEGAGQRELIRLPKRSSVCEPHAGAPDGGHPSTSFATRR
jgi:hypothetical protein